MLFVEGVDSFLGSLNPLSSLGPIVAKATLTLFFFILLLFFTWLALAFSFSYLTRVPNFVMVFLDPFIFYSLLKQILIEKILLATYKVSCGGN